MGSIRFVAFLISTVGRPWMHASFLALMKKLDVVYHHQLHLGGNACLTLVIGLATTKDFAPKLIFNSQE